jgi:hypothetical protein
MSDNRDTEGSFGARSPVDVAGERMQRNDDPPRRGRGTVDAIDMTSEPSEFVFGLVERGADDTHLVSDTTLEVRR